MARHFGYGAPIQFKDGQPNPQDKHRLLLMLDEFPSFGRLEVFQEALAFIAGYGMKAYLIMQDLTQLHAAYRALLQRIFSKNKQYVKYFKMSEIYIAIGFGASIF